jgi:hypothetical protein
MPPRRCACTTVTGTSSTASPVLEETVTALPSITPSKTSREPPEPGDLHLKLTALLHEAGHIRLRGREAIRTLPLQPPFARLKPRQPQQALRLEGPTSTMPWTQHPWPLLGAAGTCGPIVQVRSSVAGSRLQRPMAPVADSSRMTLSSSGTDRPLARAS